MKRSLLALLMLAACVHSDVSRARGPVAAGQSDGWSPIHIVARAVEFAPGTPDRRTVGELTFRGGLELTSDDPRFGGLSGLAVEESGRFVAVSDTGTLFTGRLIVNEAGALAGVEDVKAAPLRDAAGRPLTQKEDADAEEVTRLPDGRYAVSFERTHLVRIYDLEKNGAAAPAQVELHLAGVENLGANESLEAMTTYGNRLLVGAERGAGDSDSTPFWFLSPEAGPPPAIAGRAKLQDGFGLVSLSRLPDGDFIAIERFFSPLTGIRIHLRRVREAALSQDPPSWDGPTLADLRPPLALENFEGLSIVKQRDAAARLYMVSDDNFRRAQRTLLYAFDLAEPPHDSTSVSAH